MKQEEQLKFIQSLNEKGLELIKSKGHDYAGIDVLKNFKTVKDLIKILEIDMLSTEGVGIFYILLKIQRLCNLLFGGKTPKNESVEDTLIDLRNYVDLLNCIIKDKASE